MRIVACFFLVLASVLAIAESSSSDYASMVPLITDSYGIITEKDRRDETQHGRPPLRSTIAPRSSYMIWQCLRLDRVKMQCEGCSKDPLTGPGVEATCFVTMQVESERALYDFSLRQVHEHSSCRAILAQWRRVLSGQRIACFSAYYEEEEAPRPGKYKRFSRWSCLSRIKSMKGNWSD